MTFSLARSPFGSFSKSAALLVLLATACTCYAQDSPVPDTKDRQCNIDLKLPGQMKDIVSNVLLQTAKKSEDAVRQFLNDAEKKYATGDELMRAAATHFEIDYAKMAAEVERLRHINCTHDPIDGSPTGVTSKAPAALVELSPFARDVALHTVLHELGHALIREFDLPILANEETMADAFATHYLTAYMPDRALAAITARTASLMIEAREVPREQWPVNGEHNSDARRAFQIAALAIAADAAKYEPVACIVDMTESDIRKAKDYGAEIHRSWRRMLAPLMMPQGMQSKEARVSCEGGIFANNSAAPLLADLDSAVTRFDWHSQVTIRFNAGDGGASWSRSKRTVTVNSQYLQRFVAQGKVVELLGALPRKLAGRLRRLRLPESPRITVDQ